MQKEFLTYIGVFALALYSIFARYSISGWESFKWFALVMLVLLAVLAIAGQIAMRIDAAKLKRERKAFRARQEMMELRHPGTRATLLSSGRWLLTDIATGKTIGEVPKHNPTAP